MWQQLLEFIKRIFSRLSGREGINTPRTSAEAPTAPVKVKTPTPAIFEPELGLASPDQPQYRQRKSIFTYRERVFFAALIGDVATSIKYLPKSDWAIFSG